MGLIFEEYLLKLSIQKKPKISIFLPIYNRGHFLKRSISSIQIQTLKDIEIIPVNDNSLDNSLKILKKMAKTDTRIKIINNKRNRGVLYTRAMGILNSRGEYIMNLDPDDEFEGPDNLEYLYNKANKSKVDIISFSFLYKIKRKKGNLKKINFCSNFNRIIFQPEIMKSAHKFHDYLIWNKFVKKEVFLKVVEQYKQLIFRKKIIYGEDEIYSMLKLLNKNAKSMICENKLIYIYHLNKKSIMTELNHYIYIKDLIYWHEMFIKFLMDKIGKKYLKKHFSRLINLFKSKNNFKILKKNNKIKNKYINIFKKIKNYNFNDINLKINKLLESLKTNYIF